MCPPSSLPIINIASHQFVSSPPSSSPTYLPPSLSLSRNFVCFPLFSSCFISIMEPQQQQQQNQQQPNEDSGGSGKGSSFLCRQSSTRWTPTTDQIRILKDLYYNNGVRSPSAEQIQRISARLRQYGKIEGKNVFYWFQNHKARERQKKRFNINGNPAWTRPDHPPIHNKFHSITIPSPPGISSSPSSSSSSPSLLAVGQMGSFGYGSVERPFIDGRGGVGGSVNQSFEWVGMDPYSSSYALFDKRKTMGESFQEEQEEEEEEEGGGGEEAAAHEIETLPLFPIHAEDINGFCNIKPEAEAYYTGWYRAAAAAAAADGKTSLELSLSSCAGGRARDSP